MVSMRRIKNMPRIIKESVANFITHKLNDIIFILHRDDRVSSSCLYDFLVEEGFVPVTIFYPTLLCSLRIITCKFCHILSIRSYQLGFKGMILVWQRLGAESV
jgi:hypothetical protein